ncbi:MAG: SMC-Scp complex subunit ScpB [Vicinamibacterales bacterium]|nr:SMC-Scp complex subunit ScpB [Vicinamibacterales bacterium]
MAENTKKKRTSKAASVAVDPAAASDAVVTPDEATVSPVVDAMAPEEPPTMTVDDLVGPAGPAGDSGDAAVSVVDDVAEAFAEQPVSAELKAIVEALVYASPDPLTPKALCKLLDSEPAEEVERAIEALKQDYRQVRGLHLVEIAGGLQIVTRPDLNEWVRRLFHERKNTRLSVPSLETLAVIAYRQPVTAAEIADIRGVNTSGVLSTLVERRLIKTAGRKAVVGRPFLYATTKEFLLRFGLNDVSDLPKVEDLADALGFELPGLLNEGLPMEQMLPLGEPDESSVADDGLGEAEAVEAEVTAPEPIAAEPAAPERPEAAEEDTWREE